MSMNANSRRSRVAITAFLWPLLAIGVGAYRIYAGAPTTVSLVWDIGLILIGVVGLALAATVGTAGRVAETGAERLANQQRQLFGGLHTYRDAEESDFKCLDRAFYDSTTAEFGANGFRVLRDVVDVTASNVWPRNHAVLRCFVGDSGMTMAAAYDVKLFGVIRLLQLIGVLPRKLKTIECETELSDGTFATTANTLKTDRTLGYPFIDRMQFPAQITVPQIVQEHRAHVRFVLAAKPGVAALRCANYGDLRASQDRMQLLKSAHRNSPNFDYHAEWQNIFGRPLRDSESGLVDQLTEQLGGAPPGINAETPVSDLSSDELRAGTGSAH